MSEYPYYEEQDWLDLTAEERTKIIYKELLTFAKDIQQMLDDNPDLHEELCACSVDDPSVGLHGHTCPIHVLPWILKTAKSRWLEDVEVSEVTFDEAIEWLKQEARKVGGKLYLYKDKKGYFVSRDYWNDNLAHVWGGTVVIVPEETPTQKD